MRKWAWITLAFAAGLVLGGGIVWAVVSPSDPDRFTLKRDLNLESSYFFSPKSSAPVKGMIKAGSQFEVDWRYSDADYVVFRTVVDRQSLMAISQPAPPRRKAAE
jgi:hypothetical protein